MTDTPYAEGPLDAKICFIGEAPGDYEERQQRPFVGPAGDVLNHLLSNAAISRSLCRFDNVLQFRPKGNNMYPYFRVSSQGKVTTSPEYDSAVNALLERLSSYKANVFVPLGNVPLYALCGKVAITKRRGSILHSSALNDRKVIPTIHPSAAFRKYNYRHFISYDLRRIKRESTFPDIQLRNRRLLIYPTFAEACSYIDACVGKDPICFDIECRGNQVSHLSLAYDTDLSMSIPFVDGWNDYFTLEQESHIWCKVAPIMEDTGAVKLNQAIGFDMHMILDRYGIRVRPVDDTMVAMAIAFPEFPKDLAFIQSVYCEGEPYYKDEGKKYFRNPLAADVIKFQEYSARDAVIPLEAFPKIMRDVERLGNKHIYEETRKLIEPLTYMQMRGIKVDTKAKLSASVKAQKDIDVLEKEFYNICEGRVDNCRSTKQVAEYFYGYLRIKPYVKRNEKGDYVPTVDDIALQRLARRGFSAADVLIKLRKLHKSKGTYFDMTLCDDNRLRCSFNPVGAAKTGRLSSSKTIFGTGGNLQNVPYPVRQFLVADEGYIFCEIDLKQAEIYIVANIANELKMLEALKNGTDIHKQTAALIFNIPIEDVSDVVGSTNIGGGKYSQRGIGKKSDLSFNYDMSYKSFALKSLMSERDAKYIYNRYHTIYPGIHQWHAAVRDELRRNKMQLTNCYGRVRRFTGGYCDETYRMAYDWLSQSTVADKVNKQGINYIYYDGQFEHEELLNQVHDSIVYQFPIDMYGPITFMRNIELIVESLETPVDWHGREFIIPADIKIGFNLNSYNEDSNPSGLRKFELNEGVERVREIHCGQTLTEGEKK